MNDSRLVYSTDKGRICPGCGKFAAGCSCKKKKPARAVTARSGCPDDGVVRIGREVKGRKGKTATVIFGIPLDDEELKRFAKSLKKRCGTGGSVKNGVITIQGDHRHAILSEIKKQGYTAKLAGG